MIDYNFKMSVQAVRNNFVERHAGKIIFVCLFISMINF
jgi:hypothetical protein